MQSFKAAQIAGKVSIRGSLPNLVRATLLVRFAALCFTISSEAFLDLGLITGQVFACYCIQDTLSSRKFRHLRTRDKGGIGTVVKIGKKFADVLYGCP